MEPKPCGHDEHWLEANVVEVVDGVDIKLYGSQHPYFAVLPLRTLNAFWPPFKDNHAPPHNVRVNPLVRKTISETRK